MSVNSCNVSSPQILRFSSSRSPVLRDTVCCLALDLSPQDLQASSLDGTGSRGFTAGAPHSSSALVRAAKHYDERGRNWIIQLTFGRVRRCCEGFAEHGYVLLSFAFYFYLSTRLPSAVRATSYMIADVLHSSSFDTMKSTVPDPSQIVPGNAGVCSLACQRSHSHTY